MRRFTPAKFNEFLKNYKELGLELADEIENLDSIRIPPFTMPNWPELEIDLKINLGLRRPWIVKRCGKTNIIRKKTLILVVTISKSAVINFEFLNPLDTSDKMSFYSNAKSEGQSLQCFLTLSQFLKPISKKTMEKLTKILEIRKNNMGEHAELAEAVERTFSSLTPFLVSEELDQ